MKQTQLPSRLCLQHVEMKIRIENDPPVHGGGSALHVYLPFGRRRICPSATKRTMRFKTRVSTANSIFPSRSFEATSAFGARSNSFDLETSVKLPASNRDRTATHRSFQPSLPYFSHAPLFIIFLFLLYLLVDAEGAIDSTEAAGACPIQVEMRHLSWRCP